MPSSLSPARLLVLVEAVERRGCSRALYTRLPSARKARAHSPAKARLPASLAPGLRSVSGPGMEVRARLVLETASAFGTVLRRSRSRFAFVIASAVFVTGLARPAPVEAPPSETSPRVELRSRAEALAARDAFRAWMASRPRASLRHTTIGTPAFAQVGRIAPPGGRGIDARTTAALASDPDHILAGHLLRRAGFGPTAKEVARIVRIGQAKWIEQQLNPKRIDDSRCVTLMGRSPSR